MNKKEKFSFLKGKGASVGIVLCFVAVIAMVGTVTFRNYKKNMNEQIAKVQQETEKLTKENDAAANSKDVLPMEGEEDATPSQTDHADRQEQEGASATGTVSSIEETAQTGTTVTLDMGNGYAAVYGQLKDLSVSEGDTVATGEPIGLLNEPTKYYSVEGPNLYFKVMKDGEPVDPMKFME